MKHSNKPIEDFCTKFSEETFDPFETKHLKVYLVSALTFLGVCFLSTLGFAWGGMHYNWFTSPIALCLYFVWLMTCFFVLAWRTPFKAILKH